MSRARSIGMAVIALMMATMLFALPAVADTGNGAAGQGSALAVQGKRSGTVIPLKKGKKVKAVLYGDSSTQRIASLVAPGDAISKGKWSNSNKKVAAVSKAGKVTAKKAGKATVRLRQGKAQYTLVLTVKPVSISQKSATLRKGASVALKLNGDKLKKAETSNPAVATVSSAGKVTATGAGDARVTLTSGKGKRYTCSITVIDNGASGSSGAASANGSGRQSKPIAVEGITFKQARIAMKVGDAPVSNPVEFTPANASNKAVSYTTSDAAVATVDEKGAITAVAPGTATITATSGDGSKKAACTVEVSAGDIAVSEVKFARDSIKLKIGDTPVSNPATVLPENATAKTVTYASSKPQVATVDAAGLISPVASGEAVITATSQDGSKTAECRVVVEAAARAGGGSSGGGGGGGGSVGGGGGGTSVGGGGGGAGGNTGTTPGQVAEAGSIQQLNELLSDDKQYASIKLQTNEKIAEPVKLASLKDLKETDLVVDAPNLTIDNEVGFKSVTIEAIAANTYCEHANNDLIVKADKSHIVVSVDAIVKVTVAPSVEEVTLENNGNVSQLDIETANKVLISGTSVQQSVATSVSAAATIETNQALGIVATAKAALVLRPGSEGTTVKAYNESGIDNAPTVEGIGSVSTTIVENGAVSDVRVIVASYSSIVANADTLAIVPSLSGSIVRSSNEPVEGATVRLYRYTEGFSPDDSTSQPVGETVTDQAGTYAFSRVKAGNYIIVASHDELVTAQQNVTLENHSSAQYCQQIMLLTEEESGTGSMSGRVIDLAEEDDIGIGGITVRARAGASNFLGTAPWQTTTDEGGYYSFEGLTAGTYTVEVVDLRNADVQYLQASSPSVLIKAGEITSVETIGMTKGLAEGQVRFVLRWNGEDKGAPADLDSHLLGPTLDGSSHFHTYYSNKMYRDKNASTGGYLDEDGDWITDANMVAYLDHDDTDYEGPETTTVLQESDGTYMFLVHDYSNLDESFSRELGNSGAYVEVYLGDSRVHTYYVTPGAEGTVWAVCTYNSRTKAFAPVNEMGYESEPEAVGEDWYYGKLRVSSFDTSNGLVSSYSIFTNRIILKSKQKITSADVNRIVPVLADDSASWKMMYDEDDGECILELKSADGSLTRTYEVRFAIDYGDLAIDRVEEVGGIEEASVSDSYDKIYASINLMKLEDFKALLKSALVIEKEGVDVEVSGDDFETVNVSITDGLNTRVYTVQVDINYGDLKVEGFETNSMIVYGQVYNYEEGGEIRLYSTDTSFATYRNFVRPIWPDGKVYDYELTNALDADSDDDDEPSVKLTISDPETTITRTYDVYVSKDTYGDLKITGFQSNDVVTHAIQNSYNSYRVYVASNGYSSWQDNLVPVLANSRYRWVLDADDGDRCSITLTDPTSDRESRYWVYVDVEDYNYDESDEDDDDDNDSGHLVASGSAIG